jgi:hypothetical protein
VGSLRSRKSDNISVFVVAQSSSESASNAASRFSIRMVGFVIIAVARMGSLERSADNSKKHFERVGIGNKNVGE